MGRSSRRLAALLTVALTLLALGYAPTPAYAAGPYTLVTLHSNKCVEVGYSGVNDGDFVNQYTCHGGANQKWMLEGRPRGQLLRNVHSGKCLEAGDLHADLKLAYQYNCDGADYQLWRLKEAPEWPTNKFTLQNVYNGECLGIYNGSTADFAIASLQPCSSPVPSQYLTSPQIRAFVAVATRLLGYYGAVTMTVNGTPTQTCQVSYCRWAVPAGSSVRLTPNGDVLSWGPGPCQHVQGSAPCEFTAIADDTTFAINFHG